MVFITERNLPVDKIDVEQIDDGGNSIPALMI